MAYRGVLADITKTAGLPQTELARIWGCTDRTVRDKLSDERTVRLDEIRALNERVGGFSLSDCYKIVTGLDLTMKRIMDLRI